jgi:hypothetical protein
MVSAGIKKPGVKKIIQALPKYQSGIFYRQWLTDAECHLSPGNCFLGFMKSLEDNVFRDQRFL